MPVQLEIRRYAGGDRHRHDYWQILFPLQGAMRIAIEGRSEIVPRHCLAVVPQQKVHDFEPTRDCRMLVLDAEAAALAAHGMPHALDGDGPIVRHVDPWLGRVFQLLGSEVEADRRRARDAAQLTLSALQLVKPARPHAPMPALDPRILEAAHALGGLNEPPSVSEMARTAGLSQSQFHALFRASTGHSPKQLHLRRLLDRAVDRLTGTSDPIAEIAYGLGYENVSSFNRLFKRRFGVTPTEFRNAGRH